MRGNRDPRESPPKRTTREPPGPVPTLGDLRRLTCWVWIYCNGNGCPHRVPAALAQFLILWGPDASSDRLRRSCRCSRCGGLGATLAHPSWSGSHDGFAAFPVDYPGL